MTAATDVVGKESIGVTDCLCFAGKTVGYGAVGYVAAAAFMTINPVAGAIFGVTALWGEHIVGLCTDNACGTASWAIKVIMGIGIGVFVTALCGFPMTFMAGVVLTVAIVITKIALTCLGFCTVCAGGACCVFAAAEAASKDPEVAAFVEALGDAVVEELTEAANEKLTAAQLAALKKDPELGALAEALL